MGESTVGGNEHDRETLLTAGRNGARFPQETNIEDIGPQWLTLNGSELDTEYKQHLGLLEQLENVGNMSNGTSGATEDLEQQINSFYFYETEQFAVLWILFVVIVLGNTAVLVTLFLNKNRKSRMNFFIKQLAIADLSVGLLSVLTDIVQRITISWLAGNVACKLIRFVQVWVTYASTYVLVALSIDRYDAITHPMNFSGCWKRARRLVAAAWGFSAVFSSPMFYLYEERTIQNQLQCWIDLGDPFRWQVYMCWVAASLFVIPAFIISACYVIIIRTIWSKGSMLGPTGPGPNGGGKHRPLRNGGCAELASRRASSRGIIPRAKVKTVKMTIVIVIVFVLCWSPYIVFDLLQVFEQIPKTQTNIAIATFIQSLAPLNSAANPLIYCLFSTHFVRTLKRLPPFRWLLSSPLCCASEEDRADRGRCGTISNGTRNLRNQHSSSSSMRTLTTSLTVSTRRSTATISTRGTNGAAAGRLLV
ncbi:cardioacceleratory peptide receptor-like isoform X1 [Anopheles merus]|uniref:cardioacceleratory peptide receptor-like isoform X1 n=1 Tax=Anopheles merus TaxID=30066 RepID=UPI001BE4D8CB|nr:cardioacceleratory peptide receptor-like isoform X1 [Anopheles merus]XP_041761217.1 cardioacceleratory peptide receptor-like isoform X1 [Anopheles merus]XP_041761218.1 cardioacceleratory peptide receptor-like isoform X1 [Anopheles merus]XP_041761220.1 cardioacceleratory peptide receptor-like isoform X1 [Anopheles merus]XP_041761221.1 cardioacceleratory peptide receptor-like isoform X1 [Anopheles merus]XP_041761222.1 cardioacceleratory peptide receptor-like isoform X1 [Anopheles merus]XP_04